MANRLSASFLESRATPEKKQWLRNHVFGGIPMTITTGGTVGAGKTKLLENLGAWGFEVHENSYRIFKGKIKEWQRRAKEDPQIDYFIDAVGIDRAHAFSDHEGGFISGRMAHALDDPQIVSQIDSSIDHELVMELAKSLEPHTRKDVRPYLRDRLHPPAIHMKVLLKCDEDEAGRRIFDREAILKRVGANKEDFDSVEQAIGKVRERNLHDRESFQERYGTDIHDPAKFTHVIDTTRNSNAQTLLQLLQLIRLHRLSLFT